MAAIVGGIGWILALLFGYLSLDWKEQLRIESSRRSMCATDRDQWQNKFYDENKRASSEVIARQAAETELNTLKEAIRYRAKQQVIVPVNERRMRSASYADIRKANQKEVLREQQIADQKDANTAFEE